MQVNLVVNDSIAKELFSIFKTDDINFIINNLLKDAVNNKRKQIDDFFSKVEYFEDYDYKALRNRNESIS